MGKRKHDGFFSRTIAFHNPWPEVAGESYDRHSVFNGVVNGIVEALGKICGSHVNSYDDADCRTFRYQTESFISKCSSSGSELAMAIVYICTHGVLHDGKLFLMMDDSPDPVENPEGFYKNSISGNELLEYIKKLEKSVPHGKVLVLLDCCHSGALIKEEQNLGASSDLRAHPATHPAKFHVSSGQGTVIFMSCQSGEDSYIDTRPNITETARRPVFTNAVIETLMGFHEGEIIDLEKLVKEVKTKVDASGKDQHPWEYPPHWSEAGQGFKTVGIGAAEKDDVEDMDVSYRESVNIPVMTLGSDQVLHTSPESMRKCYDSHKKIFDDLTSAVTGANNVPVTIKNSIEAVNKKWKSFSFEKTQRLVLCGQTGHGKSTLVNALVEENVLPAASVGKAATLAITEVMVNKDQDRSYRAEVQFFSRDEVKAVLDSMQSWILEDDENRDPNQEDDVIAKQKKDEAVSYLNCIFGEDGIPSSTDEMLNHTNIKSFTEKGTETFSHESPGRFKSLLSKYVSSSSNAYLYHLVKRVRVFVPSKGTGIPENVALVDIPGYHDGNRVRKAIAEKQFATGDIIFIVANIGRALSDETAQYLAGKIQMDVISRSRTCALICSQNDEKCEPEDIESQFQDDQVDPQMKRLQDEIKELNEQLQDAKDKEEAYKLCREAKIKCAKWRALHVKGQFKEKFQKEFGKVWEIPVFAVSAKDYLKLLGNREPAVFQNLEDTGIFDVKKNLKEFIDRYHCAKVEEYIHDIAWVRARVEAKDEFHPNKGKAVNNQMVSESRRIEMKKAIELVTKECRVETHKEIRKVAESTSRILLSLYHQKIEDVVRDWEKLHYNTLKAAIKGKGSFYRPTAGSVCLVEDVVTKINECVHILWGEGFNAIKDQLQRFNAKFSEESRDPKVAFLCDLRVLNTTVEARLLAQAGYVVKDLLYMVDKTMTTATHDVKETVTKTLVSLFSHWPKQKKKKEQMLSFLKESLVGEVGNSITSDLKNTLDHSLRALKFYIAGELHGFVFQTKDLLTTQLEWPSGVQKEDKNLLEEIVHRFTQELDAQLAKN